MKKIVLIIFLILKSLTFGYINLYPLEFNKDITYGAGEEFTLYNRTTEPRKYRVYVESVEGKKSMADWIEVYPRSILINPLKEKNIKIYVEAPQGSKEGEYQANLVIKEISLPIILQDKEELEKKTKILTMVKLRLKGRVAYD